MTLEDGRNFARDRRGDRDAAGERLSWGAAAAVILGLSLLHWGAIAAALALLVR